MFSPHFIITNTYQTTLTVFFACLPAIQTSPVNRAPDEQSQFSPATSQAQTVLQGRTNHLILFPADSTWTAYTLSCQTPEHVNYFPFPDELACAEAKKKMETIGYGQCACEEHEYGNEFRKSSTEAVLDYALRCTVPNEASEGELAMTKMTEAGCQWAMNGIESRTGEECSCQKEESNLETKSQEINGAVLTCASLQDSFGYSDLDNCEHALQSAQQLGYQLCACHLSEITPSNPRSSTLAPRGGHGRKCAQEGDYSLLCTDETHVGDHNKFKSMRDCESALETVNVTTGRRDCTCANPEPAPCDLMAGHGKYWHSVHSFEGEEFCERVRTLFKEHDLIPELAKECWDLRPESSTAPTLVQRNTLISSQTSGRKNDDCAANDQWILDCGDLKINNNAFQSDAACASFKSVVKDELDHTCTCLSPSGGGCDLILKQENDLEKILTYPSGNTCTWAKDYRSSYDGEDYICRSSNSSTLQPHVTEPSTTSD